MQTKEERNENTDTRMEVVCNRRYGGFSLSDDATDLLERRLREEGREKEITWWRPSRDKDKWLRNNVHVSLRRSDPTLVGVVRELGDRANGCCARLEIETLPSEWKGCYAIEEYDGLETVEFDAAEYALRELEDLLAMEELPANEWRLRVRDIVAALKGSAPASEQ